MWVGEITFQISSSASRPWAISCLNACALNRNTRRIKLLELRVQIKIAAYLCDAPASQGDWSTVAEAQSHLLSRLHIPH
jgi:hypothetical protein